MNGYYFLFVSNCDAWKLKIEDRVIVIGVYESLYTHQRNVIFCFDYANQNVTHRTVENHPKWSRIYVEDHIRYFIYSSFTLFNILISIRKRKWEWKMLELDFIQTSTNTNNNIEFIWSWSHFHSTIYTHMHGIYARSIVCCVLRGIYDQLLIIYQPQWVIVCSFLFDYCGSIWSSESVIVVTYVFMIIYVRCCESECLNIRKREMKIYTT